MSLLRHLTSCRVSVASRASWKQPYRYCAYSQFSQKLEKPFDVLFFGRDEFSVRVFLELYRARHVWSSLEVVTQPDMKTGRQGSILSVSLLKEAVQPLLLPVHEIPKERKAFRTWQPPLRFTSTPPPPSRLLVTASFGRIIPTALLDMFAPSRRLNVHPSLLPAYRGPAPIQRTIIDGRKETGVCVIEMTEAKKGIDSGEIWGMWRTMDLPGEHDFGATRDVLAAEGGKLLVNVLEKMMEGTAMSKPQAHEPDTPRAPMITEDDAFVNFESMAAEEIVRRYRAVSHQKALFTKLLNGKRVQLHDLSIASEPPSTWCLDRRGWGTYVPATDELKICCAEDSVLNVKTLKNEGKNVAPAKQWWNGANPEIRSDRVPKGQVRFL